MNMVKCCGVIRLFLSNSYMAELEKSPTEIDMINVLRSSKAQDITSRRISKFDNLFTLFFYIMFSNFILSRREFFISSVMRTIICYNVDYDTSWIEISSMKIIQSAFLSVNYYIIFEKKIIFTKFAIKYIFIHLKLCG